jgi:alkylation response protein AidB-like acyl-CoA dehydrogenase
VERALAEQGARGFSTTAAREGDGYRIPKKAFVMNAEHADRFVVFAQVDAEAGWGGSARSWWIAAQRAHRRRAVQTLA